jgi:type VI secretion system ImpH/TssG family protein
MAAEDGAQAQHLSWLARVANEIDRFGLYALLRGAEASAAHLPRIGASRIPSQDVVELTQTPTTAFPGSTLDAIEIGKTRARVSGFWLGLTGPMGPLPLHLTEFAAWERRFSRQRPFGRFLDLLAGRSLQFFYRAWAASNPSAQADRPHDDHFGAYLAALSGATEGVGPQAAFPAKARLHYAGLFASHRSAAGIEDALSDLLGSAVRVEPFLPRWRNIEPGDETRLGGAFAALGRGAALGGRVRTFADAFRVVVRAKDIAAFEGLLPGQPRFAIAAEALDAFAPSHLEWELEIELDEAQARPARLNGRARLGWASWMAPCGDGGVRRDTRLGGEARRLARTSARGTP